MRVKGAVIVAAAPGAASVALDMGALLVSLIGRDAIRAALLARVDCVPEGLAVAERRVRRNEIDAELDAVEREERLIDTVDPHIARRPDARPEIVLSLECS